MLWIFRLVLIVLVFFVIYSGFKYLLHPKRKLELAHEQRKFYLLDNMNDVRKNFMLTYKGVMFEGEKYLGTTEESFEVISIFIWPKSTASLKGLQKEDFHLLEEKLHESYPKANIDWKNPIGAFLKE